MSDKGEKTCPLCAEEMDLTDQQLKPCKCGYEICVWCWHHIMEMAEKDGTEGRCPACRIPYDKERIVGMTANCERLVAGINVEKKKLQKIKPKSSEGRKELTNVRVIQRNLVYTMGLPLHLGDEDLLCRREYFGQYGRVLKVSMSRTAAGVVQQFPNSTCSVYITYSKEEEAIRCIQSVHGYILEGRPLRACFGTTKYCHTWLRNAVCSNPDCLYLHEIGSQDDSFTKDEIISEYTRNRVQQNNGPANSQQRRSGNVLPPPLDDYDSSVSAPKSIIKNASSHVTASNKGSLLNGSSDRAIGLPPAASWATRTSNSQPSAASSVSSNGLLKQKSDSSDSRVISSATASIAQTSSSHSYAPKKPNDENHSMQSKGKVDGLIPVKLHNDMNPHSSSWEKHSSLAGAPIAADASRYSPSPASEDSDRATSLSSMSLSSLNQFGKSSGIISENVRSVHADSHMENLCSDMSVMSIDKDRVSKPSGLVKPDYSLCEYGTTRSIENQGLQLSMLERCNESSASSAVGKASPFINEMYISSNECDWTSNSQNEASKVSAEIKEDILCLDNQRPKDPEVVSRPSYFTNSSKLLAADDSGSHSMQYSGHSATSLGSYLLPVDNKVIDVSSSHEFSDNLVSNGTSEILDQSAGSVRTIDHILAHRNDGKECMGGQERSAVTNNTNVSLSSGENSIISDILSLEFDPWDESASPQVLAKLLRDSDGHNSLNRISKSLKVHNNTQSRFSFARQEGSVSQPFDVEQPHDVYGQNSESHRFSPFDQNMDSFVDNFGFVNGISSNSYGEPNNVGNGQNAIFPNKLSASRSLVSAPPGFSVPSRSPPPGFTHERVEQAYGLTSGNHLLDTYSLLRNSYQAPNSRSIASPGGIFTDAATTEVFQGRPNSGPDNMGFDMRSSYAQRMNALDDEASLKLLLQRSIGQHRNIRYSDIENEHSLVNDSYGIDSRLTGQPQVNNLSPFVQLSPQQPRDSVMSNRINSRLTDQSQVNNLSPFAQLSQQPRDLVMSNGINSRLTDQPQVNNISPFAQLSPQQQRDSVISNGYWDGWNEISGGNSIGMEEHLRNERLGFNRFYSGY